MNGCYSGNFSDVRVTLSLLDNMAWILRYSLMNLMIKHWIEITSVLSMHAYMLVDCIAT